jgi:hypothetical protein
MTMNNRTLGLVYAQGSLPSGSGVTQQTLGSAFTYQGFLKDGDTPVDAVCDFQFSLYDAASDGVRVSAPLTLEAVPVTGGYFTAMLDFGSLAFTGDARWLAVAVRCPAGTGDFTALAPRQALTAAPYAHFAARSSWQGLQGMPPSFADGVDDVGGATIVAGEGLARLAGSDAVTLSVAPSYRLPQLCESGQIAEWDGTRWICGTDDVGAGGGGGDIIAVVAGKGLTGGGDSGTVTLTLALPVPTALSATLALSATQAPWAGLSGVPAGIADGDDDTTYSAGAGLVLTGTAFSVDDAYLATQSWSLTGNAGTTPHHILGTTDSASLTLAVSATAALRLEASAGTPNLVGGYGGNTVAEGALGATIGGGGGIGAPNRVITHYTTIGGGLYNTAAGLTSTIGGGAHISVSGRAATVGGGVWIIATGSYATVGGGSYNKASGIFATVGGGSYNEASGLSATVGGGYNNEASGSSATVGGGWSNEATGSYATVGGGYGNEASGDDATVGGGSGNEASGDGATVGGGRSNAASGDDATVGGGSGNEASGDGATVGGGTRNTALADRAFVGGGESNVANGYAATIPGGSDNTANANYSFAAGRRARANHRGAFVWGDATFADVASTGDNQFIVRASGGMWFGTHSSPSLPSGRFLNTSTGGYLSTGGDWTNNSDRDRKAHFAPVDVQAVLTKVAALPITTWSYKAQDPAIRHMGPMAQDMYVAFGLGEDARAISTIDADGVALAAIQGLHARGQDQAAHIAALEAENAALRQHLDDLTARVEALERGTQSPRAWLPGVGLSLLALTALWITQRGRTQ